MTAANRRVDELRARRDARAQERTAFEERRQYGLAARHAAKLAHLAARKEKLQAPDNSIPPPPEEAVPPSPDERMPPWPEVPPPPDTRVSLHPEVV